MKKTILSMGTFVTIRVIPDNRQSPAEMEAMLDLAFAAFRRVEQACSRFDSGSELNHVCDRAGTPVPVSPLLFEPLKFALQMAEATDGVFDPTVGRQMEERGFNRDYRTGQTAQHASAEAATWRDVELNETDRTVCLHRPLVLDLGAVAKGLAIDLAVRELRECPGFIVEAGGDLYAGGADEQGNPWKIGIQHPQLSHAIITSTEISDLAVCTSGGYERRSEVRPGTHHLIHPNTGESPHHWLSCSVIAPFAMMADAFATAAFLLDEEAGQQLIEEAGIRALFVGADLQLTKVGG